MKIRFAWPSPVAMGEGSGAPVSLSHHLVQHVGCAVQEFVEVGAFDHQGWCKGHVLVPAPRNEAVLARNCLELLAGFVDFG